MVYIKCLQGVCSQKAHQHLENCDARENTLPGNTMLRWEDFRDRIYQYESLSYFRPSGNLKLYGLLSSTLITPKQAHTFMQVYLISVVPTWKIHLQLKKTRVFCPFFPAKYGLDWGHLGRFVLPWSTLYSAKCSLKGQFLVDELLGPATGETTGKGRFFFGVVLLLEKNGFPIKGRRK